MEQAWLSDASSSAITARTTTGLPRTPARAAATGSTILTDGGRLAASVALAGVGTGESELLATTTATPTTRRTAATCHRRTGITRRPPLSPGALRPGSALLGAT